MSQQRNSLNRMVLTTAAALAAVGLASLVLTFVHSDSRSDAAPTSAADTTALVENIVPPTVIPSTVLPPPAPTTTTVVRVFSTPPPNTNAPRATGTTPLVTTIAPAPSTTTTTTTIEADTGTATSTVAGVPNCAKATIVVLSYENYEGNVGALVRAHHATEDDDTPALPAVCLTVNFPVPVVQTVIAAFSNDRDACLFDEAYHEQRTDVRWIDGWDRVKCNEVLGR